MGIKLALMAWRIADLLGFSAAVILFLNLEPVESGIVFCVTMTFMGYRIYHLHLDAERKRLENEEKRLRNMDHKDKRTHTK